MKTLIIALILALSGCHGCVGCSADRYGNSPRHQRAAKLEAKHVHLKHLKSNPGEVRYAYKEDNSDFWMYYFVLSNSNRTDNYYSFYSSNEYGVNNTPAARVPAGGTWIRSTAAPKQEEVEEEIEAVVEESENGNPATEDEAAQADEEATGENTEAESDAESSEGSDSAGSDSAGGDSAGGGDSGGGCGGCGGGCGSD